MSIIKKIDDMINGEIGVLQDTVFYNRVIYKKDNKIFLVCGYLDITLDPKLDDNYFGNTEVRILPL